jgi:carbon monoxide dehydrogenase subunit G
MVDMMIREISVAVPVAAPPEAVWAALTDWSRQGEWMLGTRTGVVSGDGHSVGSRLWGFTGLGDVGFLDVLEITEWAPPARCRARHRGRLMRGEAVFEVTASGSGALVRWTERLALPAGLLGPALAWGMRRSLCRLAGFHFGR